jgi:type I restriction enzyme S subunit
VKATGNAAAKPESETAEALLARILTKRRENWPGRGKYQEPAEPDTTNLPKLPNTWTWATVARLGQTTTGFTPPKQDASLFGGDIPFFKPSDLDVGYNVRDFRDSLTEAGAQHGRVLPPLSILVTCIGATIGKTGLARVRCTTNQQINALTLPTDLVSPHFVFWYFNSSFGQRQITDNASATTLPILNKSRFEALPIPLAPLAEQLRIVAEIEKQFTRLEAAVAALRRAQANLKRYRAAVLKAACEGHLVPTEAALAKTGKPKSTFESGETLLARILTERRKTWQGRGKCIEPASLTITDLPSLPDGWTWAKAEQLCEFITKGTTPSADKMHAGAGDIPFIKVYNLTFNGTLNLDYKPTFIDRKTHRFELARSGVRSGDVLINIVGPPLGQVSIVPTTVEEANINQAVARFRVVLPDCQRYVAICLMTKTVIGWAVRRAKTTAGQTNLTLELCRDLPIPLPPLAEQLRIVAEVERRLSVVDELEAVVTSNLQRACRLRQSILSSAFSGRLIDASASPT